MLLFNHQGCEFLSREEFNCYLLYILCRDGIDTGKEHIKVALASMVEEIPTEVEGKLLTIVTGDGELSLQLSLGSHQLRGRELTEHHPIQLLSHKPQTTMNIMMVTTEIDTPDTRVGIGGHRTLHRIDQPVTFSQREIQAGIHAGTT